MGKVFDAKNKRIKNRIKEHGDTFIFKKIGVMDGEDAVLVQSTKNDWLGWFKSSECTWQVTFSLTQNNS